MCLHVKRLRYLLSLSLSPPYLLPSPPPFLLPDHLRLPHPPFADQPLPHHRRERARVLPELCLSALAASHRSCYLYLATPNPQPRNPNPEPSPELEGWRWRWGWRKIWVRRGSISHRLTKNLKLNQLTRSKSVCVNIYALVSTTELNY